MIIFSLGLLFGLSRLHLAVLLLLAFAAVDDGEVESRLGGARVKDDRQPGIMDTKKGLIRIAVLCA